MPARAALLTVLLWAATSSALTATGATPEWSATYVVQAGDTLYRISRTHNTSVEELMRTNNLESVTVEVGQVLSVPTSTRAPGETSLPPTGTPRATVRGPSTWKLTPPAVTIPAPVARTQPLVRATALNSALPPQSYLGGLAYERQTHNNCGPAAVSSVLAYYGFRVNQHELRPILRPNGGYMLATVIDPYLRKFGLRAPVFRNGNLGAVKRLVSQGIPVIVLQWLDRPGGIPHFRVVRGYDDTTGLVWVTDSMIGEAAYVSYQDFEVLWNTQGRLMIPVYPESHQAQVLRSVGL